MGNDLRTAITNAMESGKVTASSPAAAAPATTSPAPVSGTTAPATTSDSPTRDSTGRFQGKGATSGPVVAGSDSNSAPQGAGAGADPSAASAPKPTAPSIKPPQSWGVKVREKWGALDPEIQAEIDKRERDVANKIREDGEGRKFRESLRPFESVYGDDKGLRGILEREAKFRNATPQQKAEMLGEMVVAGQIPVDALDSYLATKMGGVQGEAPKAAAIDPEAILRQAEQRIEAKLRSAMSQRHAQKAQSDIAAFAEKHEFFSDLQDTMGGLIEAGVAKGLDDAYDKATLLHPEVRGVIEQRKAAEAARENNAATAEAKAAAMSVRSSPVTAQGAKPKGLREQLAANIAAAGRR